MSKMSDDNLENLVARVRRLEDIEEIRRLRFEYHRRINDGEFDRIAQLYTADAVVKLDYLSCWRGTEQIHVGFTGIPSRSQLVKQFVHNHAVNVELEGDSAAGYSYFEARYARNGVSLMVAGKYDETYRRIDGGWLIASTTATLYFSVPVQAGWAGDQLHYLTSTGVDMGGTKGET